MYWIESLLTDMLSWSQPETLQAWYLTHHITWFLPPWLLLRVSFNCICNRGFMRLSTVLETLVGQSRVWMYWMTENLCRASTTYCCRKTSFLYGVEHEVEAPRRLCVGRRKHLIVWWFQFDSAEQKTFDPLFSQLTNGTLSYLVSR